MALPKEHRENVRETLVEFPSLHVHCGAQPHRQRFALRCTSQVSHGAGGHQGPAWSTPSEQGARKFNVFNAAPSCHAESFGAMYQVGG